MSKPSLFAKTKARIQAMNDARTVIYVEFLKGDYFVILVPVWQCGMLYYRRIEWTSFHDKAGLPIMSNTYHSARHGLNNIFEAAKADVNAA